MNQNENRIGPLKKVAVMLEIERPFGPKNSAIEYHSLEFIFGLGPDGLTPFESALHAKEAGQEIPLTLYQDKIGYFFGYLHPLLAKIVEKNGALVLKARIEKIAAVDQREVIKELANLVGCGDHCCDHQG